MASKTDTKAAPTGIRVHDLAKEFGVTSKVLIEKCKTLNIKVKNHASMLTRGQSDRLRAKIGTGEELREQAAAAKKKTGVTKKAVTKKTTVTKKKTTKKTTVSKKTSKTTVRRAKKTAVKKAPVEEAPAVEAPPIVAPVEPTPVAEEPAEAPTQVPVETAEAVVTEPAAEAAPKIEEAPTPEAKVEEVPSVEPTAKPTAEPSPEPSPEPAPEPEPTEEPKAAPKVIQAGPDLVPPVEPPKSETDPRFGVVISADEAKKLHGEEEAEKAKKAAVVESKKPVDFNARVTYPSLPAGGMPEEQAGAGRRGGLRRAPVRTGRRAPRRGRALMVEGERYRKSPSRKKNKGAQKPTVVRTGPAEVTSPVTISQLCAALGIKAPALIRKFMELGRDGVMMNTILTDEEAELYAAEFDPLGFGVKIKKARDVEEETIASLETPDKPEDLTLRAPVVTVMGHVDHGKTSLLDHIRRSAVVEGESGGITQHIAAYKVKTAHGPICFLDTPGHKAFTEMRARGANVTDIVILVVAADDGVMPQTEEAINHSKAANKRMIVAVNKIDLPDANAEKVKAELAAKEVFLEGYGGDVQHQEVSAKTGQGIQDMLEGLALEAEVLELKANPNKPAVGTVVEAHKDPGRGIVCTLLVQEGTLKQGDVLLCGHTYGSVRQLLNDRERPIKEAGPSVPVLITGLNDVPLSGERFHVLDNIKHASEIADKRAMAIRQEGLIARQHVTLENLHDMIAQGEIAALKLVLKVDVMGSLHPIQQAVAELSDTTEDARIEVLHSAVGAINETDVLLADASGAIVIGFHVTADPGARKLAEERGVEIRTYEVIYDVVDEMRKALEGMLKPVEEEIIQGHLEVRQTFKISRIGTVAGCFVTDGTVSRNSSIRLVRDGKPIWTGKLDSLKRVKDDVREVREGFECGVKLVDYNDVKQGDTLEAFTVQEVARTLDN